MTVVKLKKMFDSKYLIVYNPISGRRKSRQVAEQIHFEFNQKARSSIITGKDEDSTREILQREIPNHDAVIAVGGDGLMNLVIQLLAHSPKALYVYPAGSGNDFQRTNFSFKKGKSKLVEDLNKSTEKVIDLALVKFSNYSRYFGQVLSAGFDSYVNARANKLKRIPGTLKYVVALLLELPSFKQLKYKMEVDGNLLEFEAMMVVVGNGSSYGGGMKILPDANPKDGFLDLMILHPVSKFELLKVFPQVFRGAHIKHPKVEIRRFKNLKISCQAPIFADGEYFGNGEFEISIEPDCLKLWN